MKIALFPDPSLERWPSMDLYAEQLRRHLPEGEDTYEVVTPPAALPVNGPARWIGRYLQYPRLAGRIQADVYHVLDHSYGHLVAQLDPRRTVVTVHDCYPLHMMQSTTWSPRGFVRNLLLQRTMRHALRAARLLAVSEFTKKELLTLTDYPPARIRVILSGVEEAFFENVPDDTLARLRARLRLPDGPILLHVGSCNERKNIPLLLRVLRRLLDGPLPHPHLLQVGGQFTGVQRALIRQTHLAAHLTQVPVASQKDLIACYRLAGVCVIPSTYEGFGWPVFEAMASGTPVVAARAAALPEAVGDAGLLVEPHDLEGFCQAIQKVLKDEAVRSDLIQRGRARAKGFSWKEAARQTAQVYREVADDLGKVKVWYLSPAAHLGGAERSLADLVSGLPKARFRPTVLLFSRGPLSEHLEQAGVEVRVLDGLGPLVRLGRYSTRRDYLRAMPAFLSLFPRLARLRRWIHDEGVQLIHSNGLKTHLLLAGLAGFVEAKTIWHWRDMTSSRRLHWLLRWLAARSPDRIIAVSDAAARDLGLSGAAAAKVVTVYNGVDLKAYSPAPPPPRPDGLLHVGMVGVLAPWKGHHLFLEAARRVATRWPAVRLSIVGDELYETAGHQGYRASLERLVRDLNLEASVTFTGFQRDIPTVMASLDVVVHASLAPEPFGRVLIEAMACGRPVVATDAGGVPEVVEERVTGLLVPPGDPTAMVGAILDLLADEGLRRKMGEAGRSRVERLFSLERSLKAIEAVYDTVLAETEGR